MHDLISHICRQIGPCNVTACTWAITEKAVTQILNRRKDGLIKDFRLWIDPRVKVRNPVPLQMCRANFDVCIAPVHAKVAVIWNDQWRISVSGSLNFGLDTAEVARQFQQEKGEIYECWFKGYLSAQAEIRQTVLDAALNSSQPAILQMLRYYALTEQANLEAFDYEPATENQHREDTGN